MPRDLVVIYGPPLAGKSSLAWALARSMDGPTAVVSTDQLTAGSIAITSSDVQAELDMVHIQLRLLVANYLKSGYHVIVEGPFVFERGSALYSYDTDIDQLLALMRHLASRALTVRLDADESAIEARTRPAGRDVDVASALRTGAALKDRYGERHYRFDTATQTQDEILVALKQALGIGRH